jgi:hypothetical protein
VTKSSACSKVAQVIPPDIESLIQNRASSWSALLARRFALAPAPLGGYVVTARAAASGAGSHGSADLGHLGDDVLSGCSDGAYREGQVHPAFGRSIEDLREG